MATRTTTIRVHDAQLQLLETIAERDNVSVADIQRTAFSEYIDRRVKTDEALKTARERVIAEWQDKGQARTQEALEKAVGPIT